MTHSPSRGGADARLPSLTGMRFLAALMVFSLHTVAYLFERPNVDAWAATFQLAAIGVSYFFVLSGFILTWSARPGDTVRGFWRRRFFKIYPNHLVTFVAAALILTLVVGQSVAGWGWLPNLLLVQSWSPDIGVRAGFNQVAWSLSCEVAFYVAFPLLLAAVDRIRGGWLWVSAAGVVTAILLVPSLSAATGSASTMLALGGVTDWDFYLVYQFPLVRMLEFVFGIILARLVMTGRWRRPGLGLAAVLGLGAFALTYAVPPTYRIVAVTVVPLGVLIAAGALSDLGRRPTWLASRPMVWLGEISYAFFMWHVLVLLCGYHWFIAGNGFGTATVLAIGVGLLGVTILVAWLQFTLIERPIMRRFSRPRRAAVTPLPGGVVDGGTARAA
jgi:peptidoglycan/LPS O-acetylase OafA/YrhL